MNQERAKLNLKKYRISKMIISILGLLIYILCAFSGNDNLIIPALVFSILFIRLAPWFFYRKYITDPLSKDLNASLYYEMVRQGKIYVPSAIWQLQAEYFVGNYKNAVSICNQKLNGPKCSKKYKYSYFVFLANVYFDLGDIERLADICKRFKDELSNESKRKAKRIQKRFSRIEFYESFIAQDFDSCYSLIYQSHRSPVLDINQIRHLYFKARIALCKDDREDAEKLFKSVIQKAPNLNYADLSRHGLESIEKGIPYKDTFDALDLSEDIVIPEPPKVQRVARIVLGIVGIMLVALVVVYISFSIFLTIRENEQNKQHEKELAEYRESIRVLIEEQYDNVEILDIFYLKYEDQVVESMFLCKTDAGIVLGSLYSHVGEEKTYFDVEYQLPYSDLETPYPYSMCLGFYCTVPDYYVECYFYTNENEIPSNYYHLSTVQVKEKTLYIVIMPILTEPPFDI